ncbi:MAG: acyl-CoA synthetase FdrA [Bacillota bacterium]
MLHVEIRERSYYDSVALMQVTNGLQQIEGIEEAMVAMGTDMNKELLQNVGMYVSDIDAATPNDLIVAIKAKDAKIIELAREKVDELLTKKQGSVKNRGILPSTLSAAMEQAPDANLVLISVPGAYAAGEAEKALAAGKHVMIFSDNVKIEDEVKLKNIGREKGLLVMGPDCGTSIINGVPLAFANVVPKGNIGIVGASGTGIQEVTSIIGRYGMGISQAIGTGGRDLRPQVGGISMLMAIEALVEDPETDVIGVISKPPSPAVAEKILKSIENSKKPVVVSFLGSNQNSFTSNNKNITFCYGLEDTAFALLRLAGHKEVSEKEQDAQKYASILEKEIAQMSQEQKYLRAWFTGGTLCYEAMHYWKEAGLDVYSNIPLKEGFKLANSHLSKENTAIDFGEDEFTVGKPHPMIDPTLRRERMLREIQDKEIALVLLDFVLGYGCSLDPVGEMLPCHH